MGADFTMDELGGMLPRIKALVEDGQTIAEALKRMGKKSCCTKVEPVQRRLLQKYGVEFRNTLIINGVKKLTTNLSEADSKKVARALTDHILMLGNN